MADLRRNDLVAKVALVSRDAAVLAGSLRENLLFGISRPVADEELRAALRAAGAASLLGLPQGLDAPVAGESASLLDSEQRQRLGLWRDFEAFSKGRTTLVFAAAPGRGEGFDRIVVLREGAVAESGTHSELMALAGLYKRMVDSRGLEQAAGRAR